MNIDSRKTVYIAVAPNSFPLFCSPFQAIRKDLPFKAPGRLWLKFGASLGHMLSVCKSEELRIAIKRQRGGGPHEETPHGKRFLTPLSSVRPPPTPFHLLIPLEICIWQKRWAKGWRKRLAKGWRKRLAKGWHRVGTT